MNLMELLPKVWENAPEMAAIQDALTPLAKQAQLDMEGCFAQLNPETATWGLDIWEQALGLATDLSLPEAFRRSRIISKLRGQGTTTAEMLKNVAERYTDMDVEVGEYPPEYRVEIRFVGALGSPANLDALTKDLSEIMPAHLARDYIFKYQTGTLPVYSGFFVHMGDDMTLTME